MPTPSGFPTSQDLINAQKDVEHLGRVVNSEDAQGNPIASSTNRTGGVNKTLDALQAEYQSAIQAAGGVPLGAWASGVTYNAYNEYLVYNGIPYKPAASATLPYTTQGADPTVSPDAGLVVPFVEVVASDLVIVREDLLGPGTQLYMGDDGESVKVGDTVPAGTTHLRVDIDGSPALVAMSPATSGSVTALTDATATINGVNVDLTVVAVGVDVNYYHSIFDFTDTDPELVTDWLPIYEAAKTRLESDGGGTLVWPYLANGYSVSNTIWQPSNTVWIMYAELVATTIMSPYECIISPDVGSSNIRTYNLQLNGDNIPAVSGLMPRRGCSNVKYFGVSGRNFAHDTTRKGGRLFSPQGGSDGGGNFDIEVFGLHGKDIYNYIDIAGDELSKNSRINVVGGTVENCEAPFTTFNTEPNYATYPQDGDAINATISNIVCKNVGVSTTYIRNGGIFNFAAGGNVSYDNIRIYNDSTYTSTKKPNIVMGKFSGVNVTNVVYEGECSFIVDGHLWTEENATSQEDVLDILDSNIDVVVNGAAANTVFLQTKQGGGFNANRLKVKASVKTMLSSTAILPASYSSRPDCTLDFTETSSGKGVSGSFEQIALSGLTLSGLSGVVKFASGFSVSSNSTTREGYNQMWVENFHPALKLIDRSSGGVGYCWSNNDGLLTLGYDASKADSWQNLWQYNSSRYKPVVDNQQDIGDPSQRIKTLYLVNSPSVTSDDRYKQYINISEAEKRVAKKLKVRKFKYSESINNKGEDRARMHFGYSAQSVITAFESEGLNAFDYALIRKVPIIDVDKVDNIEELSEDQYRLEVVIEEINAFLMVLLG